MCNHDEPAWEAPGPKEDENIWIPDWNEGKLNNELAKLNKRARKIGCNEVSYNIVDEKTTTHKTAGGHKYDVRWLEIEFDGQGPKINGWRFLGTLDHNALPGQVIVDTVPGEKIPEYFHDSDAVCDHCEKIRRRNQTFVLINEETEEYRRVGRQCVREFIGYDVKDVMWFLTRLRNLVGSLGGDEWRGGGGYQEMYFDPTEVLAVTAAVIEKEGWVSKKVAWEQDRVPTASWVGQVYFPPIPRDDYYDRWVDGLDLKNDKWHKLAEAARAWLKEQSADGEYWHNLHAIDKADIVSGKLFGYWCSLISTYQRAMYRQREKARTAEPKAKKLNEHIGTPKERIELTVEVATLTHHDSRFGVVHKHQMLDNDGRTIIWWANTMSADMVAGGKYRITAKVKKHDEFRDWKQTLVTHVKVQEVLEEPEEEAA